VKGGEFVRRVKKISKQRKVSCQFVASHGKGSHGTLYYGHSLTIVQDPKRELPTGTLRAMLNQLGLKPLDLQ
jgi:mRNA interferase HicA